VNTGSFLQHRELADLPRLVRKQRRLEKRIATLKVEQLLADEKAARAAIHDRLVAAGIPQKGSVTCNGYDVIRRYQDGFTIVDVDKLRVAGVPEVDIQFASHKSKAKDYAEVKPSKGAQVRKAA